MNKVFITGNVVNEPEAYTTQNGISRSTFRVAVQRKFTNAQGQHDADFLTVVTWRQSADFCNKYLHKGSKVAVEGSIQTRSYDAQDGSKRWVTEIVAEYVESMGRREGNGEQPAGSPQQAEQPKGGNGFQEVEDEELPF